MLISYNGVCFWYVEDGELNDLSLPEFIHEFNEITKPSLVDTGVNKPIEHSLHDHVIFYTWLLRRDTTKRRETSKIPVSCTCCLSHYTSATDAGISLSVKVKAVYSS